MHYSIKDVDPTNGVIFDRGWLLKVTAAAGLLIVLAKPPTIRGFQWILRMVPQESGRSGIANLPDDIAPFGVVRPPV